MTITERVSNDLKEAMRSGDKARLDALRLIRAALLELEKSGKKEVTDEDEMKVLLVQVRQRKDAIETYSSANRQDLVDKEEAAMKIIQEYLPTQLDDDQIRGEVLAIIAETGASGPAGFKVVMPRAMASLRGRADGAKVQAIVKEELSK